METINLNIEIQKPIISLNGKNYLINTHEIEAFFKSCEAFSLSSSSDLVTQTRIIADTLIDQAPTNIEVGDLKNNIKFLREIEFLFRDILTPIK